MLKKILTALALALMLISSQVAAQPKTDHLNPYSKHLLKAATGYLADNTDVNQYAGLKLSDAVIEKSISDGRSSHPFKIEIHYPVINKAKVDELIQKRAAIICKLDENDVKETIKDGSSFNEDYGSKGSYAVISPSKNYLSVLTIHSSYFGGAHDSLECASYNYDLNEGRLLTAEDIFPKGQKTIEPLVKFVNAELDREYASADYKPIHEYSKDFAVNYTQYFVFTPAGITAFFEPYAMGSYAEGIKVVDIPKDKLIGWGVPDSFWQ